MKTKTILFLLLTALVTVWLFVCFSSYRMHQRGDALVQTKTYSKGIDAYGSAIRWYAPFNPWVKMSIDDLMELGASLEKEKKYLSAQDAYGEVRYALSSVRSVYFPYFEEAQKATAEYIKLEDKKRTFDLNKTSSVQFIKKHELDKNQKPFLFLCFAVMFGLWLFSVCCFVFKGFDDKGGLKRGVVLPWGLSIFVSFGVWVCLLKFM